MQKRKIVSEMTVEQALNWHAAHLRLEVLGYSRVTLHNLTVAYHLMHMLDDRFANSDASIGLATDKNTGVTISARRAES